MKSLKKETESPRDMTVKTDLSFEELMKKALNTPLPKQGKVKKGKKK